jgi:hypothetical protein
MKFFGVPLQHPFQAQVCEDYTPFRKSSYQTPEYQCKGDRFDPAYDEYIVNAMPLTHAVCLATKTPQKMHKYPQILTPGLPSVCAF